MAKTKRRKNLNKDFQKVKLKVGKSLPKADNVTNTSFKSGSIQLKDQLKASTSGPSTKRKLNINDLLTQLQHYSTSVRHDALTGLRELGAGYPDVIHAHLGTIVERVSVLFVDKDSVVRQAVVKFLKQLFQHTTAGQISPFFPILSVHLRCAMTHIYDDIQRDSLGVLDLCLEFYPQFTASDTNELIQNFLEQISKQQNKDKSKSRSLNINPGSKTSTQKWRTKVLQRLHRFLSTLVNDDCQSRDNVPDVRVTWRKDGPTCHQPMIMFTDSAPALRLSSGLDIGEDDGSNLLSSWERIQTLITTLLPMLIECWIESSPSQLATQLPGNALPQDSLEMMGSVLSLIQLLWQCVDMLDPEHGAIEWLREKYEKDCVHQFMSNFPYSMHEGRLSKKKGSGKEETSQSLVRSLNLSVCRVMSYFMAGHQGEGKWFSNVVYFITDCLLHVRQSHEDSVHILSVVKRLLDTSHSERLLSSVFGAYKASHYLSADKRLYLQFFADLVMGKDGFKYSRLDVVMEWMQSLPILLLKSVENTKTLNVVLDVIHKLASRANQSVLSAIQQMLPKIFDSKDGLFIKSSVTNQRQMMEIVFWLAAIDHVTWRQLMLCLRSDTVSQEVVSFAVQVLHHRCVRKGGNDIEESSVFLSFLLSLMCGYTSEELSAFIKAETLKSDLPVTKNERLPMWQNQLFITKCVGQCLKQFPCQVAVWNVVCSVITKLKDTCLPLTTTMSILHTLSTIHQSELAIGSSMAHQVGQLCKLFLLELSGLDDGGHELSSFKTEAQCLVIRLLKLVTPVTSSLLESFHSDLKGLMTAAEVREYSQTVLHLITDSRLKVSLPLMTDIISQFEMKHSDVLDRQIMADLKYALTLLR